IPSAGCILAAADAYHAMTEPRPYRPALSPTQAAGQLRGEVRSGRLAADAADAVLTAAGQRRAKRRAGPAGLTPREVEVLTLIARGASTRQAAHTLGITAKTAETHIERIYAKTGASTRSTATLFAMGTACSTPSNPSICRANPGRRWPPAIRTVACRPT
ncbi:MAG TPA: LuxR C-terminal-related transcriptional regulator, partial [Streptosporangiaceae bacterium]|nr:LuxR C-terminal-related transcriptional regulator [Streptosporangiaceae bacterium]